MMHNFVLPPFPELGWNEWPNRGPAAPIPPQQDNAKFNEVVFDPVVEEIVHDEIVPNGSLDTASSVSQVVNMDHDAGGVEVVQHVVPAQALNVWHFQYAEVVHPDIRPLMFAATSLKCDK
jgi:hypothetical protein